MIKKHIQIGLIAAVLCLFAWTCSKNGAGPGCGDSEIETVFPIGARVGDPVLIKGQGFGDSPRVFFDAEPAQLFDQNESYLSTKVPAGLNGPVQITVETETGCLTMADFQVVTSVGGDFPNSPNIYIIPPSGFSFPVQVAGNETMFLTNLYDEEHTITLFPFKQLRESLAFGNDFETWNNEDHEISEGFIDMPNNQIRLVIDRPGLDPDREILLGGFYTMTLEVEGELRTDNFFLAFSEINGRQYFFSRQF